MGFPTLRPSEKDTRSGRYSTYNRKTVERKPPTATPATAPGAISDTNDYRYGGRMKDPYDNKPPSTTRKPTPATMPGAVEVMDDCNMRFKDPRQRSRALMKPQSETTNSYTINAEDNDNDNDNTRRNDSRQLAQISTTRPTNTSTGGVPGAVRATDDFPVRVKDPRQRLHSNQQLLAEQHKMKRGGNPSNSSQNEHQVSSRNDEPLTPLYPTSSPSFTVSTNIDLKRPTVPNPNHQRGRARAQNRSILAESQSQHNPEKEVEQHPQQNTQQQQHGKPDDDRRIYTNRGMVDAPDIVGQDLAMAIAINEDNDLEYNQKGVCLPAAIEYDPDAKPPLYKHRRMRIYLWAVSIMLCISLLSAGTIVILTHNQQSQDFETFSPTRSPTLASEVTYRDQFAEMVGFSVYTPGTPSFQAAEWIIFWDQQKLSFDAPNLPQRFLLTLFYFLTTNNGELKWRTCSPVAIESADDWALAHNCTYEKIFRSPIDDSFSQEDISAMSWLSPGHECDWAGVTCDDLKSVQLLELWGQNITGTLPTELAGISSLQSISLIYNEFRGTIPTEYARMKNLINLELHGNFLTGTIPDAFWGANALQMLNFGENMLTGTISTKVGQLSGLKGFFVSENRFSGTLPSEIGLLRYLSYSRFDDNLFTGTFPSELGRCTQLREVWTQKNRWTGNLPSELGKIIGLVDLRFFGSDIRGTIPEELYNLHQLSRLELYDMNLDGTLSTRIGELTNLVDLRLRKNGLTGTIPTEVANLDIATLVWVHLNKFEGSVPNEICDNRGGSLRYLGADCGPESSPSNPCSCCTNCCDRATDFCLIQN